MAKIRGGITSQCAEQVKELTVGGLSDSFGTCPHHLNSVTVSVEVIRSHTDEIYIYIRVGMMEIDQSSFTSVLSVHR